MSVTIRTLGQDQVLVGGKAVHWPSRAARDLFYMLLVSPRGYTKAEITELLWGNAHAPEGNSNFKVTHFRVRQALGDQRATQEQGGRYVLSAEYYLQADHVRFQQELSEAKAAGTRAEQLRHLYAALELYGGDFLPDHLTDWAEETRNTLRSAYVRARLEVAQAHCSGAECHAAIRNLAGALATDPLIGEGYHQNLMTCLCTLNRSDDALAHYRHFLTFIQREIGDTPAQDTVRLADQIRNGLPHLSQHIGAQTPCPRRTLYGDAYVDHTPQPELEAALLESALERGARMLALLRQIGALHDWTALAGAVTGALAQLLHTPYTGMTTGSGDHLPRSWHHRPGEAGAPGEAVWPPQVERAVASALDRELARELTGQGQQAVRLEPAGAPQVRVLVQALPLRHRPPHLWLWAAWEEGETPPDAASDLLGGVADVLTSVVSQPRWAQLKLLRAAQDG